MKKNLLLIFALCMAVVANAQDFPYSKYLNFSRKEFRENGFKYNEKTNAWCLTKSNGWNTAFTVLAIIADAYEDIRPARNDYSIVVQMGEDDTVSYIEVEFYNNDTYHKLLTFMKNNCQDMVDTSSGKLIKYQATYENYGIELDMKQHIVSRTSARTIDPKAIKNVDESYNEYEFIIRTDVEPWSKYLEKRAAKSAKRDAKGKKKRTVNELM